jgi:hypothetical protein
VNPPSHYVSPSYLTLYVVTEQNADVSRFYSWEYSSKVAPPTPAQTVIKPTSQSSALHFRVQNSDTLKTRNPKRFRVTVTRKERFFFRRVKLRVTNQQCGGCRTKRWRFCFSLLQVTFVVYCV